MLVAGLITVVMVFLWFIWKLLDSIPLMRALDGVDIHAAGANATPIDNLPRSLPKSAIVSSYVQPVALSGRDNNVPEFTEPFSLILCVAIEHWPGRCQHMRVPIIS